MHLRLEDVRSDRHSPVGLRARIQAAIEEYGLRQSEDGSEALDVQLLKLLKRAPPSLRAECAERLSGLLHCPPLSARALACDPDPEVARPILRRCSAICERTLVEMALCKGQQHLEAIAGRKRLPGRVTRILLRRGDKLVLQTLARNRTAEIAPHCRRRLEARLASPAAVRRERPEALLAAL